MNSKLTFYSPYHQRSKRTFANCLSPLTFLFFVRRCEESPRKKEEKNRYCVLAVVTTFDGHTYQTLMIVTRDCHICILVIVVFNDKKIKETSGTEKKGPEAVLHD